MLGKFRWRERTHIRHRSPHEKDFMNTLLDNEADPRIAKDSSRLAVEPGISAPSRVGGTVRIEGEISGKQDMLVDGEIAGSIMLPEHTLTIGSEAHVQANIKAK